MPRTFRSLILEARTLLQDKVPPDGVPSTGTGGTRFSDTEMFECINGAMAETRTKRADLFLPLGLRNPLPFYTAAANLDTTFPLDVSVYNAFVYYIVGRCELRDDPYADDARAVALLNKFTSQLLTVTA